MTVNVQYAEEHFADLITAVDNGEEVEITRAGDKPALVLVSRPVPRSQTPSGRPRRELWGAGEGLITLRSDEEWKKMDNEFAAEILNHPIFPEAQP
jgi:prevent-host-death family protein